MNVSVLWKMNAFTDHEHCGDEGSHANPGDRELVMEQHAK